MTWVHLIAMSLWESSLTSADFVFLSETESNIYLVLGVRSHIYKVPLAVSGIKEIFRKWQLSLSPPSSSLLGKSPYDNGGNQATTVKVHF